MPEVDYLIIDDSEVEPGAPILSSLGVRWRDNAIAIAQGASGAPRIDGLQNPAVLRGGIVNNAIVRSKIQTATNSVSGVGGGSAVTIQLDQYSFFPSFDAEANRELTASSVGGSGANNPKVRIGSATTGTAPFNISWRFIAS